MAPGGRRGPGQLRSAEHPPGLPGLEPEGQATVDTANAIHDFVGEPPLPPLPPHTTWSVENPTNSYVWWFPSFARLLDQCGVDADLTACNFGSERDKKTRFRTPIASMQDLGGPCRGKHA